MDSQFMFIIVTAIIGLYFPINQFLYFEKAKEKIINDPSQKEKFFKDTILYLWLMAAFLALLLFNSQVTAIELGFTIDFSMGFLITTLIVIGTAVYFFLNAPIHSKNYEGKKSEYEHVRYILPDNKRQYTWVVFTSITAGITEEFIFRAYMFWFFNQYMEWYLSIIALNLVFSLCHVWSGIKNMIGAFSMGLVLSLLYVFSGSILTAMILHIVTDMYSAKIGLNLSNYEKEQTNEVPA